VFKDVLSVVKLVLFLPEKLKLRNISSAWLLSSIYEGSDLNMGVQLGNCMLKQLDGIGCWVSEF